MSDNHSKEIRSKNMSRIRSADTKPEAMVRKYLFHQGYRFRKNVRSLPGTPDIVLKKYRTIIFVNGCFWHMHNCKRFRWPTTHEDYWTPKIKRNAERDIQNRNELTSLGWNVLVIWECELKKDVFEDTMRRIINELEKNEPVI